MRTLVTISDGQLRRSIFTKSCMAQLQALGEIDFVSEDQPYSSEDLHRDIPQYDAVITGWGSPKLSYEVLQHADRLKFVGHTAGTLKPYVDPVIFKRPVVVVNANSVLAKATADLTIAHMCAGAWHFKRYQYELAQGNWRAGDQLAMGLLEQPVGIVGFGEIAQEVIHRLHALGARVSLYSPYCTKQQASLLGVRLCSLEVMMKESRIISLHDTLTDETRGMIGRRELGWMQDGALLINTARAPIVEEEALLHELRSGRILAGLDVYHQEPLPHDDVLRGLSNVICTPHIGGLSEYVQRYLAQHVVEELGRFCRGENVLQPITYERFLRMTPM